MSLGRSPRPAPRVARPSSGWPARVPTRPPGRTSPAIRTGWPTRPTSRSATARSSSLRWSRPAQRQDHREEPLHQARDRHQGQRPDAVSRTPPPAEQSARPRLGPAHPPWRGRAVSATKHRGGMHDRTTRGPRHRQRPRDGPGDGEVLAASGHRVVGLDRWRRTAGRSSGSSRPTCWTRPRRAGHRRHPRHRGPARRPRPQRRDTISPAIPSPR